MNYIKPLLLLIALLFLRCTDDDPAPKPVNETDTGTSSDDTDSIEAPPSDSETQNSAALLDLFPHTPSSYWTFHKYGDSGCRPGESTAELLEHRDIDGRNAAVYLAPCIDADSGSQIQTEYYVFTEAHVTIIGVTRYDSFTPLDIRYFDTPLMDGHTWSTQLPTREVTYRWRYDATVTVPAGTFSRCWTREEVDSEYESTFCPSVGRVRWTSGSDDDYDELVDYFIAP